MSNTPAHQRVVRSTPVEWYVPEIRRREQRIKVGNRLVALDHRFEWRCDLLGSEQSPVDGLEEGVFFKFGSVAFRTETMLGVSVEKLN